MAAQKKGAPTAPAPTTATPHEATPVETMRKWFEENHARLLWASGRRLGSTTEEALFCYALGARVVIVQAYSRGGCEVFIPITASPRIDDTIRALEAYKRGELVQWAGDDA